MAPARVRATSARPSSAAASSARSTSRPCAGWVSRCAACWAATRSAARRRPRASACRRAYPSLEALLDGPGGRRRPRHLPQPAPLPAGQGDPRRRPARHLREAAGGDVGGVGGAGARWRRASDRITAVNFNIRFYPLNQHAHQMVARRRPGRACASSPATTSRTGCSSTPTGTGAWSPTRAAALRAVGDIGSHWIDLTSFITRPARRRRSWPTSRRS